MARGAAVLMVVALAGAGCTTSRYVGGLGRTGTYVNRGYGFVVRLSHHDLLNRFDVATAKTVEAPLDLDADGFLDVTETTRHTVPALRLISKTSTAVRIDVDVRILAKKHEGAPLQQIALGQTLRHVGTSTTAPKVSMTKREIAPDFDAYVLEGPRVRIAVIDQPGFLGEEGLERRQIVTVTLTAPAIDERWQKAHEDVLEALILNRRGGTESTKEEW